MLLTLFVLGFKSWDREFPDWPISTEVKFTTGSRIVSCS